jgi:hypothetical protein
MRKLATLALCALVVSGVVGSGVAWAKSSTAIVTVLHGLPGLTADVYVNGELTLDGFEPLSSTDPLELPAGSYDIAIREVGASADSEPALEGTVKLEAGTNVSIIAHPNSEGVPALSVFQNDVRPVKAGMTRLEVRHVAAASDLDVSVDQKATLTGLGTGKAGTKVLPAGRHDITVTEAQQSASLIGPETINLKEGTARILYVTGSLDEGTLDLMSQTLTGLQSRTSVFTGDGGLAAEPRFPLWATALMIIGALAVAGAAWSLVRSSSLATRPGR